MVLESNAMWEGGDIRRWTGLVSVYSIDSVWIMYETMNEGEDRIPQLLHASTYTHTCTGVDLLPPTQKYHSLFLPSPLLLILPPPHLPDLVTVLHHLLMNLHVLLPLLLALCYRPPRIFSNLDPEREEEDLSGREDLCV